MQISGLPPDIYSTFEFALYAFLISLGFVYLLKYTDSHNYVQENGNFSGGGGGDQVDGDGGGGGYDDDDQVRDRDREDRDRDQVPSAPFSREFCGVCGDWAYSRCSRCKAVRYCSESCQIKHWRAGHKIECREFNKSHSKVESDFAAGRGRQSSGYMGTSSSDYQHSKDGSSDETIQSSKRISRKEHRIVEECPICLSTIHTSRHSRPSIGCDTCKHKFHSTCLSKWFLSSKKSSCPLCLSTFRSGGKIVQSSIKIDRS